ncbi:MAG: hypothetical protein Q7S64_00585 [bacterium]|nr:hypothetical protein [bacterium]
MKPKINQSKAKRLRTTKSGLVKRSRVGQQHRRASKSNRQKRAAKTALVSIARADKKLLS